MDGWKPLIVVYHSLPIFSLITQHAFLDFLNHPKEINHASHAPLTAAPQTKAPPTVSAATATTAQIRTPLRCPAQVGPFPFVTPDTHRIQEQASTAECGNLQIF